ncbi:TetR/AcrR family transcriptional regulator [Sporosarcina sp. D27]|uniref:TetR/AcrR family transcriptional regulator n=1 Tax=Sporosarcina sp. D27 TaxID=1382305 RepID=UPI00046F7AE5|nr:TetR/AcrR family transcriptional regulator [Sporosarcina sp. D27]
MIDKNLLNALAGTMQPSGKKTVKQERIIESAIILFAEKGYSNTSTAEIAKMAEVAEGTIFKHYGTKENLLLSLLVPFLRDFLPVMADELMDDLMTQETSFQGFLKNLLKNRSEFFLENREVFQIFIKELIYKENLKNELLPYIIENGSSRLTKVIENFQKRGELVNKPAEFILKTLGTVISGFFISRFVLLNRQSISDEEIDEIIFLIVNGIGQ